MMRIHFIPIDRSWAAVPGQVRCLVFGLFIGVGSGPLSIPVSAAQSGAADDPSGSSPAVKALSAGRRAKGEGKLADAEARFQKALAAAERDSPAFDAALEELTYQLPLMRVERYVTAGQWPEAERQLQDLLERHQSDEEKSRHLVHLIAEVRKRTPVEAGVHTQPGGGRRAIRQVQRTLERFFEEKGRYPNGYRELNELLPAGRFPLSEYDIVHYVSRGGAYGLTLRSKSDPENLLSVQKTGLVQ
jgi:tetratricopeptide (TPR) repeat protein